MVNASDPVGRDTPEAYLTFNLHHGQMRIATTDKGIVTGMRFRSTSPKRALMMASLTEGNAMRYDADAMGNIRVSATKHLRAIMELGYPMYVGEGKTPVAEADLLYPHPEDPKDPYIGRILETLKVRKGT